MKDWPPHVIGVYAHIPLIRLEGVERVDLPEGDLVTLPYGVWQQLDGGGSDAPGHYEKTAPVFFRAQVPIGGPEDEFSEKQVGEAMYGILRVTRDLCCQLHQALLLASPELIPGPELSATYLQRWATGQHMRSFGPFEREAILFGHREGRMCTMDAAKVETFLSVCDLLRNGGALREDRESQRALRVLQLTARPEYASRSRFVQCVAALEALLNPSGDRPLGDSFARRAAALLGDTTRDFSEGQAFFRGVYAVRSELIHGGDSVGELARLGLDETRCFFYGRVFLCEALLRFARWSRGAPSSSWATFRAELEASAGSRERMLELRRVWQEVRTHGD